VDRRTRSGTSRGPRANPMAKLLCHECAIATRSHRSASRRDRPPQQRTRPGTPRRGGASTAHSAHVPWRTPHMTRSHGTSRRCGPNRGMLRPCARTAKTRLYQAKRVEVRGIEPRASTVRSSSGRTPTNPDEPQRLLSASARTTPNTAGRHRLCHGCAMNRESGRTRVRSAYTSAARRPSASPSVPDPHRSRCDS
jgi:hypothetical protein